MNKYEIKGKTLENGSYVLIDTSAQNLNDRDAFLFIVNGGATLKKYKKQGTNVFLLPESHDDFHTPIVLSESDSVVPNGKVVDVFQF